MPLYTRTLLIVGPPEEAKPASVRHREHLRELHEQGKLRSAGEFANGDGFLEIFEAADLHEAQTVAAASPLVSEGLGTWMLREWTEIKF
jgi:uncharacterized protein YciI